MCQIPQAVWFSLGTVPSPLQAGSESQWGWFPAEVLILLSVHSKHVDPSR